MKKIVRLGCILCLVLMMSGCMNLKVSTGIEKDHTAFLEYNLNMDFQGLDDDLQGEITAFADELKSRYEANGFEIVDHSTDSKLELTMTLRKSASNYDEAYSNLQAMLNDPKISFLLNTDMTTSSQEFEQGFTFYADVDVPKVLNTSFYSTFPLDIRKPIEDGIAASNLTFELSLPSSSINETNGVVNDEGDTTQISFPVSLTEPSSFTANARWTLEDNTAITGTLDSLIEKTKDTHFLYKILVIVFSALALMLVIGILLLVIRRKKARQKQTMSPELVHENRTGVSHTNIGNEIRSDELLHDNSNENRSDLSLTDHNSENKSI